MKNLFILFLSTVVLLSTSFSSFIKKKRITYTLIPEHMRFLFLMSFACYSITTQAQYYGGAPIEIKIQYSGFKLKQTVFKITDVVDKRADQSMIGEVYFGVLDHHVYCYLKKGIPKTFTKYFKKGLNTTIQGDIPITIEFRRLSMNEEPGNFKGGARHRLYGIEVEYYAEMPNSRPLVHVDSFDVDTIINLKRYNLDDFCLSFFQNSFQTLDSILQNDSLPNLIVNKDMNITTAKLASKITETTNHSIPKDSENTTHTYDTSYSGEIKVRLNGKQKLTFRPTDPTPLIAKIITEEVIEKEKGTYILKYNILEKDGTVIFKEVTPISYKQQSISPYWYITVPVLILTGFISGYNGN